MKVSSSLSDNETRELLQQFYDYFTKANTVETGRAFEEFLRMYLIKMGLDEVVVTKRSRDGGIDLTAIRKGFGDFSETDITKYYIQAKRNAPSAAIPDAKVRELKGTIPFGHKGIFITTARFTNPAIAEADNDPSKPVVLIDGKSLLLSCIDNEIGFVFKPIFSKGEIEAFIHPSTHSAPLEARTAAPESGDYIEKTISANDIRARIVRIPKAIINTIDESATTMTVLVNDSEIFQFTIASARNYLGGVTDFLRKYGLLTNDGVANPANIKWLYGEANALIKIFIEV
jgi:restriction system protein